MPQKKVKNEFISPVPMGKDQNAGVNRDCLKNMGVPLLFPQINREDIDGPGGASDAEKNNH